MKITVTDKNGVVYQLVPVDSLKYWLSLAEINPRDLAPRIAAMLAAAHDPELPEGLEPVANLYWDMNSGGKAGCLKVCYITPCDGAFPVVSQSAALAALAKKEAEIAKHDEESGRVIAWQLKTIERQAALIEKCREALLLYSNLHVAGQPEEAKGALAAIKEHFGDKE